MQVNCQTLRSWQQQKKTADSLSQEFSNTVRRYSIIITGFKSALHTRMQCITFISFLVKLFQNILRYHTNDIVVVVGGYLLKVVNYITDDSHIIYIYILYIYIQYIYIYINKVTSNLLIKNKKINNQYYLN